MPRTIQADGRTLTVPDDATPDEINQIVGPSSSASSPKPEGFWESLGHTFGAGKQEAEQNRQDFLQHPILSAAKTIIGGPALQAGRGLLNEFMRSTGEAGQAVDAATGGNPYGAAEHGMYAVPFVGGGIQRGVEQLGPNESINPGEVGTALGTSIQAAPALADPLSPVTRPIAALPGNVLRGGLDILSGTTPKVAQELGQSTAEANTTAQAKAADANATIQSDRARQLQQHFEKTQQVRGQNEAAQAAQSRKVALQRGVEQLDPKFQDDLKTTEKNVRAQANEKYNTVRAATAGETVPSAALADAVKTAEAKIQGSSENLKVFRDILSKSGPEEDADVVTDPTEGRNNLGSARKGEPMYDIIRSLAKEGGEHLPVDFSTLQGYYSELGDKLAGGNLPGDVYQAMKSLQGSVGDLMQTMAENKGVGDQLTDARGFYRDYMNTFRDSRSPLNKAMNATERGKAIAALKGADQSGVQALARYNPDLAQRANTIRGYQAEAKSIPAKAPATKAEPVLPPKPTPVLADVKKIGLGDIQDAKAEALQKQSDWIRKRGSLIASGYGAYHFLASLMHGNLGGALGGGIDTAIGLTATQALAKALENPRVVKYLTTPTPSDIAAIPPEVRGDMPQIVKAAQAKGIKVHPALLAMGQTNASQH